MFYVLPLFTFFNFAFGLDCCLVYCCGCCCVVCGVCAYSAIYLRFYLCECSFNILKTILVYFKAF